MHHQHDIIVIGCGVIGLSTAIRLREAGYAVTIYARDLPPNTTSNIAAAIWYPYKAYPEDLVTHWSARSYQVFQELVAVPESGVVMRMGSELFTHPVADPWWRDAVPGFRRASPDELLPGFRDGYVFAAPVIETPRYMSYLRDRFEANGGTIIQQTLTDLAEAFARAAIVVNCTGLGARELVSDQGVYPIRGQIVRLEPHASSDMLHQRFIFDEHGPNGLTYIVPRSDGYILGGTAERDNADLTPDPLVAAAIQARAIALQPALRELPVAAHLVGLRPGRDAVCLELRNWGQGNILIHNYGHGGAGVTLSWGCAEAVVALLKQAINTA